MKYIIALLLAGSSFEICHAQIVPFRKYRTGERYQYRITTESIRNGKPTGNSVAVSEHNVLADSVGFSERIRWIEKKIYEGDSILNNDNIARQVAEYKVSLDRSGKVLLPSLDIPGMVGEITDLNTFYVAVSPALNAQKLTARQKVIKNPETREGNFADNKHILYGKDCMIVTQELLGESGAYIEVKTVFSPPGNSCMRLLADSLVKPDTNDSFNFQMIQKGQNGKVNYFWGVESFEIVSKIEKQTGKIIEAAMVNELNLKMLYNCDPDIKRFDAELPVSIKRKVYLKLLDENGIQRLP
jgi:hypothetical protein